MKIQDSVLGVLFSLSDEDVGSVLQPSAQPITKEGTLTKAIHEIGLSKAPQPVIPTPFFKTAAVSDSFWQSKGKRKLTDVSSEDFLSHVQTSCFYSASS